MKHVRYRAGLLGLVMSVSAPVAFASGSSGSSVPSGGYERIRDPYQEAYDLGRRTLKRDVTCKTCLFPEGVKDRETALAVIARLETGELALTERKTAALVVYLDRRFTLGDGS